MIIKIPFLHSKQIAVHSKQIAVFFLSTKTLKLTILTTSFKKKHFELYIYIYINKQLE